VITFITIISVCKPFVIYSKTENPILVHPAYIGTDCSPKVFSWHNIVPKHMPFRGCALWNSNCYYGND